MRVGKGQPEWGEHARSRQNERCEYPNQPSIPFLGLPEKRAKKPNYADQRQCPESDREDLAELRETLVDHQAEREQNKLAAEKDEQTAAYSRIIGRIGTPESKKRQPCGREQDGVIEQCVWVH